MFGSLLLALAFISMVQFALVGATLSSVPGMPGPEPENTSLTIPSYLRQRHIKATDVLERDVVLNQYNASHTTSFASPSLTEYSPPTVRDSNQTDVTSSEKLKVTKVTYGRKSPLTIATILLLVVAAIAVLSVILTAIYIINRAYRGHSQPAQHQHISFDYS